MIRSGRHFVEDLMHWTTRTGWEGRMLSLVILTTAQPASAEEKEPTLDGKTLTEWVARLKSADVIERWIATEAVGKIGPAAKTAVPALAEGLKDKESVVRIGAAESLGRIGPAAKAAV